MPAMYFSLFITLTQTLTQYCMQAEMKYYILRFICVLFFFPFNEVAESESYLQRLPGV